MISRDKVAQCFVRFEGTEAEYERKDVNGDIVRLPKYENGGYFVLFDKMANKFRTRQYKLNSNDFAVLMSIVFHLEFNSNIVRLTNDQISTETGIDSHNVPSHIANLQKCRLILKQREYIIVNVNYLFKGDLLAFYKAYKEYYPEDEGIMF